jgi:DNA polymerase I-like protein with 3'-5' exonuclease and polymerase domains
MAGGPPFHHFAEMPRIPRKLVTNLDRFRDAIGSTPVASIDFETSGLNPRVAAIGGLGAFLPASGEAFYINVGHHAADKRFPRYDVAELADAIRPFLMNTSNVMVAHHAAFELRFLFKMNLDVKCHVACTMHLMHRVDENLSSHGESPTFHDDLDQVTYGLKKLITIFAREVPPELHEVDADRNVLLAPIKPVADYCVQDCVNAYYLFLLAQRRILETYGLTALVNMDNCNQVVTAKMMWAGIGVDFEEAARQKPAYQQSIQACKELIWRTLGIHSRLDTPTEVLQVLRSMNLESETGYDPFMVAPWSDDDPSVSRDVLTEIFHDLTSIEKKQIIAAFLSMSTMKQRISAFINPYTSKSIDNRLYADRFTCTTVTTRFSSSPNLQNMPSRSDKPDQDDPIHVLPPECRDHHKTRDLFVAAPGNVLVSFDLSAAEPHYIAMACQRALQARETDYKANKRGRNKWREEAYPHLMDLLYSRRTETHKEQEIIWPELEFDPLWVAFRDGRDPYEGMLIAVVREEHDHAVAEGLEKEWFKDNRWIGKRLVLAIGYGVTAQSLATGLGWTVEETEEAIAALYLAYPVIPALKELTLKELAAFGEIRTLWNRPRRINGYYQLARPEPLQVQFTRRRNTMGKPFVRTYRADVIPVGSYRQGCQVFVERCWIVGTNEMVMECDAGSGAVKYLNKSDAFVRAVLDQQFNDPPFANLSFSQVEWVQEKDRGLIRHLPRQAKALRQAFNAIFQGTGADHLRWLMNNADAEVCSQPEFADCQLILTMHDSLTYEVPKPKWQAFAKAIRPVLIRRPEWATLDIGVEGEVGERFGSTEKIDFAAF